MISRVEYTATCLKYASGHLRGRSIVRGAAEQKATPRDGSLGCSRQF